jgi:hypothetical protein
MNLIDLPNGELTVIFDSKKCEIIKYSSQSLLSLYNIVDFFKIEKDEVLEQQEL